MGKHNSHGAPGECLLAEPGYCQCGCGQTTGIAPKTRSAYGVVKGQRLRYVPGHTGRPNLTRVQRLERSIEFTDSCWLWTGPMSSGYGLFIEKRQHKFAHVAVYELFVDALAEGLVLHHECRVKRCVNPHHLLAITQAEHIEIHRSEVQRTKANRARVAARKAQHAPHP